MTRTYRILVLFFTVAIFTTVASAQTPTGTPPFGSFGGGPDIISLANLNSHITIPVLHKAGRGTNLTYDLSYDTSVWYSVGSSGNQSWQPVGNWGWRGQTDATVGYVSYSTTPLTCYSYDDRQWEAYTQYYFLFYIDAFGTTHPIGTYVDDRDLATTCLGGVHVSQRTVTDGSGLKITVTADPSATVARTDGTTIYPPLRIGSSPAYFTDRNGNQISVSSGGVFTDTLGTTALTVAGGAPNPLTFTYTAPSGAAASYTVTFSIYTVQTAFGCSGISNYGPTNVSLVSEIDLPDIGVNPSDKYTFTYEQTPGVPSNVTGRLASVTLPTGGTIYYTYSGGNNGIICADGSTAGLTRQTPDGTWTYARTIGSGAASTTTITDPQNNQTVVQFQGTYETQRQVYQGSTSGTLLQTVNTCYNGSASPCTGTAITLPITQRTVLTQLPGASNLTSQCVYTYNANGALIERDDYDYGPGAPGALLRKTVITLASLGNITAFRQQVTVTNGAGTTVSQTNYNYDETAVTTTTGTPQHISVSGSRGNLTSVNSYTNASTYLTSRFTYFDTGNVQTATDVDGAQTTYNYPDATSTCGNTFRTSVNEPLSMSRSMTWNCTGGVPTSVTDENGKATSASYTDAYFWRPASATDPTSAVSNFTYNGQTSAESSLAFNSGASAVDALQTFDGLGRQLVQQMRQAPGSSNFDSVETDYDSLGRPRRATLPYVGTAGQTNSSAPATTATYDALGRVLSVTDAGGASTSYTYTQNDVLVTIGPAPSGENTKRRQLEYDGLGRLTSVCELTGSGGSGTCGQNSAQIGYWTKYTYDALGNLTGVIQNAQASPSQQQTRAYAYDFLSRLTSETNAESGPTSYAYDTDSTCGTSSGDLVKGADAVGDTICYAYDALHRVTSAVFSGPNAANQQGNKYFVYDAATVNGQTMQNDKTRMAEAYTAGCPTCSKITDVGFSYSARGEVTDVYQSTSNSGGYYHLNEAYWAQRVPSQLSGLSGLPSISYGVDGEGRVNTVSSSAGQNPVTSVSYNAFSLPTQVNLGSSDSDAFSYDANTGRMTQYQFNVNGQSVTGTLTWNANATLQQLVITDPFNSSNSQTCTYAHDDLTRLGSANCGSVWSQTFGYDPFGNLTKSGSMSFQPTYSASTNRMTSLPGFTPSYDANGNVLNDNSHAYTWNADNRPVNQDGIGFTIDALNRVVEQNRSGAYTQIVYAPTGEKLALMSGQTLQKAFIPLPGKATAVYTSSGLSYYRHPDWLGSARFGSTPSRTMYSDVAYAPFGEPYTQAGATDLSFTGINQDTDSDSFDFPARQYSTQGRWSSPDPAGLAAVNPAFPQSWNRYPYVMNNPQIFTDPTGMVGQEDAISGHRDFWSSFAGGSFGLASIPVVSGYELYHGYCVGCSLAMWGINDPSLSIATPWGTIDDNQYWGLANVLIPNVVGNGVNLLPNLPLGPSQGGNVGSGPTPAEAATQYCEDHGQITRVVRGTDNVETTLSASFTIGPVNYNTKNEITPVIPAMPWPQWLSLGAGLDFGFNVPKGSAPSWNVGLGRNLGMSFYTNAQRKTTGFNINLGPSIGPPLSVSPGSTNACGLVNRNR